MPYRWLAQQGEQHDGHTVGGLYTAVQAVHVLSFKAASQSLTWNDGTMHGKERVRLPPVQGQHVEVPMSMS